MICNDVITSSHQTLINAGKEGIRLWGAEDALQWGAADLGHTLCAALQEEGHQRAYNLGRVQLICAERAKQCPALNTWSFKKQANNCDVMELFRYCFKVLNSKGNLPNEVESEANQRQKDVLKRRGQRQGLAT